MITIPLYVALFIFFAWVAIFIVFLFLNVYHFSASASLTTASFFATLFVCVSAAGILFSAWKLLHGTDWQAAIITLDGRLLTGYARF